MLASAVCAVHCAATGLLVAVAPFLVPSWAHTPAIEAGLLLTAALLGGWTAVSGYRRHRSGWPPALYGGGLVLACLGMAMAHGVVGASHYHGFFEQHGHAHSSPVSGALSLLGGLALVAFFLLNARLRSACGCPACAPDERPAPGESRQAQ